MIIVVATVSAVGIGYNLSQTAQGDKKSCTASVQWRCCDKLTVAAALVAVALVVVAAFAVVADAVER